MTDDEWSFVRPVLERALDQGLELSVFDSEEWSIKRSTDLDAVKRELGATCEETVVFHKKGASRPLGSMFLVYGNAPDEVIADHTYNADICALVGTEFEE